MPRTWHYPVLTDATGRPIVVQLHDADTARLLLDAGCDTGIFPWLRVADVQAWELGEPGGIKAAEFTAAKLRDATHIEVTVRGRSFARWVADIVIDGENLADALIAAGHGKRRT